MPAVRLNLSEIERSLHMVEVHWQEIDDELDHLKIGRKDTPFNAVLRERMMAAYEYLDTLVSEGVKPFALAAVKHAIELK